MQFSAYLSSVSRIECLWIHGETFPEPVLRESLGTCFMDGRRGDFRRARIPVMIIVSRSGLDATYCSGGISRRFYERAAGSHTLLLSSVGVWIETMMPRSLLSPFVVAPPRTRGLKLSIHPSFILVGAWIAYGVAIVAGTL